MDGTTPAGDTSGDGEFEPTAEMMVNDFDDERTLDEEEALEEAEDQSNELSNLEKEKDMPIEALLAMYGYNEEGDEEDGGEQQQEEENLTNQDEEEDEEDDEVEEEVEEEGVKKDEVTSSVVDDKEEDESETVNSNIEVRLPESDEPNEEVEMDCEDAPERSMLQELYKDDPTVTGSRNLRSGGSRQQSEEEEDEEEEDGDYSPEEEDWKKTIMVGSDFQAEIPAGLFCKYDDAMPYENEDKLLWDPASMSENDVTEYLNEVQDIQAASIQGIDCVPRGSHCRDDEQALYLLLQCGHNRDEAIRRQKINFVSNADSMSLWSEEECRNFETGLRQFGKDFHSIQQNRQVRTRSVSELVQFYYLWKKTERHDVFANKARLEKKKYTLHPGTTDYMERFLDEQDSPVSSPSVHSLLSGLDPKRTRTPPPNNNSFNDTSELITEDEAKLITSHYEEIARHLDEKSLESLVKLAASSSGVNKNGLSSNSISSPSETFTN